MTTHDKSKGHPGCRCIDKMHDACADRALTERYSLGLVIGRQFAAEMLRRRSGEAFAEGKDQRATLLRDLANEVERDVQTEREKHDAIYSRTEVRP